MHLIWSPWPKYATLGKNGKRRERIARGVLGCTSFGLLGENTPLWETMGKIESHGECSDASHLASLAEVRHTGEKRGTRMKRIARTAHGCVLLDSLSQETPVRETRERKENGSQGESTDESQLVSLVGVRHTGRKRGTGRNGSHGEPTDASHLVSLAKVRHTGRRRERGRNRSHEKRTNGSHLIPSAKVRHTGGKRKIWKETGRTESLPTHLFRSLWPKTFRRELNGKREDNGSHGERTDTSDLVSPGKVRHTRRKRETGR
ncbi:hypothetical protein QAD02_013141 [Eretmocerus hayati]|uniref:Uncharacterized protein n=1 Tax=Eretmocerus hayati TaxID=131215 RepID=A0ACC2P219_9HYME|nr:hypothetical protein QAD02_013141 [Eretmocerus hayati]